MVSQALRDLGTIEFMQLLQELHKLGYQKLRWFSYVSPNGCALRCHITTQDNIFANREIIHLSNEFAWAYSTGLTSSRTDIKPLIRTFWMNSRHNCLIRERVKIRNMFHGSII